MSYDILISSPGNGGHRLRLLSYYKKDFGQMLRGEFHKSLPLLLTDQQLSVLRSLCTIPHLCISLFETGIRVTRYGRFVNVNLQDTLSKICCWLLFTP